LTREAPRPRTRQRRCAWRVGPCEEAGGFDAEIADIEAVAAHHANYMPLVHGTGGGTGRRCSRSCALSSWRPPAPIAACSNVEHALAYSHLTRAFVPGHVEGAVLDVSFASEPWQRWSATATIRAA
jgi:hypothetical protein